MLRYFLAAVSAFLFIAASSPTNADSMEIPAERSFPSSAGEVVFHHQMHIKALGIECVACHHQINAKTLNTPHPDYFKSSSIKCEICHDEAEQVKRKAYVCSACHRTNPINIADETLSAKVVVHKSCWKCHAVGTGTEASKGCKKCHSGKKTF